MSTREIFEKWWSENQHAAGVWQHDILLDFIDTLIDDERITATRFQLWLDGLYDDRAIETPLVYGAKGVGKTSWIDEQAGIEHFPTGVRTIGQDELHADWVPERASGHDGYRHRKTGEWRYAELDA